MKLNEKVGLKLWVRGQVVRVQDNLVAVKILRYEFRTCPAKTA